MYDESNYPERLISRDIDRYIAEQSRKGPAQNNTGYSVSANEYPSTNPSGIGRLVKGVAAVAVLLFLGESIE